MNTFVNNILKMSSAPFVTQLISYVLTPIITRLFLPSMFGVFNLFSSLIGPLNTFSNFSYHDSIVLPKTDTEASRLVFGGIVLSISTSLFSSILIFIIPNTFWDFLGFSLIIKYIWLIPLSIFMHGANLSFNGWNQRKTNYSVIVNSRIFNALNNKLYIIIAGIIGFSSAKNLIVGMFFGSISMLVIQSFPFLITWRKRNIIFSFNKIIISLKKYMNFPIYIMTSDVIYRLSNSIVIILLVSYFTQSSAGNYGMAIMLTSLPAIMLGSSISEVFYQKAASEKETVNARGLYLIMYEKLVSLSVFFFLSLAIISNELCPLILGENWSDVGIFVQLLCFQVFIEFIMFPIMNVVKILDKHQYSLFYQILILCFSVIAIIIGKNYESVYLSILFLSIFKGLITFIYGTLIFKETGISQFQILLILIKDLIYCFPFILPVILVKYFLKVNHISLMALLLMSGILYYFFLIKKDKDFVLFLNKILRK